MRAEGSGFVHDLDPILFEAWGIEAYWYGLAYALGFLSVHVWMTLMRRRTGWGSDEVYALSITLTVCVLVGARAFEIVFYEWSYYAAHPGELLSWWHGGMASHGVLIGATLGMWLHSQRYRRRFLEVADRLMIPGALILTFGRIGNFINGEIVGYPTDVPWAVQFPGLDDFRHPVALYEAAKNLALVPILLWVARGTRAGEGKVLAHFVLWYGLLRLLTDHYRDYAGTFLGIGTGQYFNALMALLGVALLAWFSRSGASALERTEPRAAGSNPGVASRPASLLWSRVVFAALLLLCLGIPSGWTQGVIEQYRNRTGPVPSPGESGLARGYVAAVLQTSANMRDDRPLRENLERVRAQADLGDYDTAVSGGNRVFLTGRTDAMVFRTSSSRRFSPGASRA